MTCRILNHSHRLIVLIREYFTKVIQSYCVEVMYITQSNKRKKNEFMQKMFYCMFDM